jgi:hypothetical protein
MSYTVMSEEALDKSTRRWAMGMSIIMAIVLYI